MSLQKITTLISLITILSCKAGHHNKLTERQKIETYDFLNFLINTTDGINYKNIKYFLDHDKYYDPPAPELTKNFATQLTAGDSIFKKIDETSIFSQANQMSYFYLEQDKLSNRRVISAEKIGFDNSNDYENIWIKLKTICNCQEIASVSLPIFSKDYQTVLVSIQYYTEFNGGGVSILYKKINGQWKYIKQLAFWDN